MLYYVGLVSFNARWRFESIRKNMLISFATSVYPYVRIQKSESS